MEANCSLCVEEMRSRGAKYSKLPASALGTGYNGSDVDELAAGENLVRGKDGIWITPEMREMMEDKNLNVSNLKKKALAGRLEKEAAEAQAKYQRMNDAEWATIKKMICFAIALVLIVMAMVYRLPPGFAQHYHNVRTTNAQFTKDAIEHTHKAYRQWQQGRL